MRESAIQKKIRNRLKAAGWFVTKLIQTSTNGIPDQLALKTGRAVFIEVKQPGKKPTDLQDYMIAKLKELKFEVIVADKVEDIEHLC